MRIFGSIRIAAKTIPAPPKGTPVTAKTIPALFGPPEDDRAACGNCGGTGNGPYLVTCPDCLGEGR